jgi:hypothetical protein
MAVPVNRFAASPQEKRHRNDKQRIETESRKDPSVQQLMNSP